MEINEEKYYEAVKNGVKEAFLERLQHVDIDDAIEIRVWSVFNNRCPCTEDLKDIYYDAVNKAHQI